jgi:RNA polymerase II elongation factor ELL
MTGLEIPEIGLSLRPGDQPGEAAAKPAQFMRLNLAQNTLDELISSLRSDDSTAKVRLGKHPTLHYGNKTQSFHAYPETHRSEIYHTSDDKQNLYFTGVLSHSLEVEKAREATAATDQALANLEESLNAFERGKASKSTHMIQTPEELKALRATNSVNAMHRASKTKSVLEKDRLLRNAGNRSLTSSPTLGAPRSPLPGMTPTSAPSSQAKNSARLQALRAPLIHLLAIRPVSAKFLARQTRSTIEDCTALVQKYGTENRIDREKYDLKDKFYKDLDVWKFPYPTQDDRQAAIDKAISAFDRMRLSRTDTLWQSLLPKEERGKGKCLSKLNLQSGLAGKKPATPRIAMDGADDRKDGDTTGNETDRPKGTPATGPKKTSTPAAKARVEKEPAKRPAKNKATNSTLTGRITKKTGGRPPAKTGAETKYKSAEFVHDSDESDDEMPDASSPPAPAKAPSPAPAPVPAERPKPVKGITAKKTTQVSTKPRPKEDTPAVPTPKVPKAEAPTPKLEATKAVAKRPPSIRPSTSPQKPSPLSSPPASASDATGRSRSDSNNQSSSSSSSSPLISQLGRAKATGAVSSLSGSTRPANGTSKGGPASVNPLKRKAEPERPAAPTPRGARATPGKNDTKRRRAVSTSSGGSTGSASPSMAYKVAQRQLWDKSQRFKKAYAKYRSLHDTLAGQVNPRADLITRLEDWHEKLTQMKNEIWEEDRKLRRDGSYS